ncbi:hypothetical protein ACQBJO_00535 [Janibacter sp. G349]|uniref:hypothetical protein n=1 Tax=unclassified Janibacter TaxID=2649294 RepID=UPI003B79424B
MSGLAGSLELGAFFALGVLSALVPIVNAEAISVGAAAVDRTWLPSVVVIGLGQGVGKIVLFLGVRRGSAWTSRHLHKRSARTTTPSRLGAKVARWAKILIAQLDRPVVGGAVVFVSAISGFPPLLVVAVAAAMSQASLRIFALSVIAGRIMRFVLIAYPVASAAH